jgi:GNAT superfamily N-acetyltransferase
MKSAELLSLSAVIWSHHRLMNAPHRWTTQLGRSLRDADLAKQLLRSASHRIRSDDRSFGLKRDLDAPHVAPEALIAISVRPIRDADVPQILGTDDDSLTPEEKWDRVRRFRLLESGAGTCFVAVTADDVPCYMQWLFSAKDNEFVQDYFPASFPILGPDTALLENAFTPEAFRGQRIMSAAMSQIAEQASSLGARYVITFVGVDNTASLKGCNRAGFEVYTNRLQKWRAFRLSVGFQPV